MCNTEIERSFLIRDLAKQRDFRDSVRGNVSALIVELLEAFDWDADTQITLGDVALVFLAYDKKPRLALVESRFDQDLCRSRIWDLVLFTLDPMCPSNRRDLTEIIGGVMSRCLRVNIEPRKRKKFLLGQLAVLNGDFDSIEDLINAILRENKQGSYKQETKNIFHDIIRLFPPLHYTRQQTEGIVS